MIGPKKKDNDEHKQAFYGLRSCRKSMIHMYYAKDRMNLDNPLHNDYEFWDTIFIVSYRICMKVH